MSLLFWVRKFGEPEKVAVNQDYKTRLDCKELKALEHEIGNGIIGIRMEFENAKRKFAESGRHLLRMETHIARVEDALRNARGASSND